MSRLPRSALGLTIAIALISVIVSALPGSFLGQIKDITDGFEGFQRVVEQAAGAHEDSGLQLSSGTQPPLFEFPEDTKTTATSVPNPPVETSTSAAAPAEAASTAAQPDSTPSTTRGPESSTTTTSPATTITTATSPTTTTTRNPPQSDGTITGDACPCTVTGTVELRGSISLQGDLTVMGGTLVARPGVDLDGNGYQIMFVNGGNVDFQGTPVFTWSGKGSSQNLNRDIIFRNMRRIIFMGAGPSTLRFITVMDSGTPNPGDFPLHWHVNGDSTRGTLVEGVVVLNGANHAFVPHGSHGITFKDTIAKNIKGGAYWWNPVGTSGGCSRIGNPNCTTDNSNDIIYDHALADGVDGFTGFMLRAGSGNKVINSVAINVNPTQTAGHCSGFAWPEDSNQNVGGNVWVFENNRGESACHGIRVWQNDGNLHVIDGFTGGGISQGAYGNNYEYRNVTVPYLDIHAAGFRVFDSNVGVVTAFRHLSTDTPTVEMTNVQMSAFIIQNASNSGTIPGVYVLNNTNMTCGDVVYANVVPGTQVIIDGQEC